MPADFRINLARDLTSSEEERTTFYNRMLIYLVSCAALLVLVAYLTSTNLMSYLKNRNEQKQLYATAMTVSGLDHSSFKNPQDAYAVLDAYAGRLRTLKGLLNKRVQMLPVVHNLFVDLPEGVALQGLSANKTKLSFGLVMPPPSAQAGDPVKDLRESWENNEELMSRVSTIRPLTGERRTIGDQSMFFVQFECILKK